MAVARGGRRRKGGRDEASGGAPLWMVTYGDMMSLLLTFFVLLVSFSTIQEAKFYEAIKSLQGALGVLKSPPTAVEMKKVVVPELVKRERSEILYEFRKLEQTLLEDGLDANVDLRLTGDGIQVKIEDSFLFSSGRAELRQGSHPVLEKLSAFLGKFHQSVEVTGHTDSVPISTIRFPSNWELSSARAIAVARFFQDRNVDPHRMSAVGYGEFRPLADNDTVEGRASNRRVEIFLRLDEDQGNWHESLPLETINGMG